MPGHEVGEVEHVSLVKAAWHAKIPLKYARIVIYLPEKSNESFPRLMITRHHFQRDVIVAFKTYQCQAVIPLWEIHWCAGAQGSMLPDIEAMAVIYVADTLRPALMINNCFDEN